MINKIEKVLRTKKSASKNTANLYLHLMKEMGVNAKEMTARELLKGMAKGTYPSFDTVSRNSRMIRNKGV